MKEFEKYKLYITEKGKIVGVNEDAYKYKWQAYRIFKELFDEGYGSISEDGDLIEIHTGGWSDNEALINEFKETVFWFMFHQIEVSGGHYYFNTGGLQSEQSWEIRKETFKEQE